jgi:2-oxoglutarate dehydrogenase E1 component
MSAAPSPPGTAQAWLESTALAGGNAPYVEALYERYLADPSGIDPAWCEYFRGLAQGGNGVEIAHGPIIMELARRARAPRESAPAEPAGGGATAKQGAVSRMVQVYANRGHLIADIDPLRLLVRERPRVLELSYFGLGEEDLDLEFYTQARSDAVPARMRLRDILRDLQYIYCERIGAEFAHVSVTEERLWLQDRFQTERLTHRFSRDEKREILWQLTAAEGLERYLHTKYVGQKRFSLEGADSLIPMLDDLIQRAGSNGVEECVAGMAHRGRLNVLVNLLGKSPADLFSEFEGHVDLTGLKGSGDVKYHKGFSADLKTPGGNVHVALAFNPSHLEIVDPVVEGSVRARQDRRGDSDGRGVMAVLMHGDAAFAGQGVVMETLQLSQTPGFRTGGTVHLVINNQVGFTTDARDARSTLYCSDVAKMIEAPIFHVNGDDPEACVFVTRLALDYRLRFRKDVVIDLVCYRRHGHNEADEPAATQPVMYEIVRRHRTPRDLYAERLVAEGTIGADEAAGFVEEYRQGLDAGKPQARASLGRIGNKYTVDWSPYLQADPQVAAVTAIDASVLQRLGERLVRVPEGFSMHPRVAKLYEERRLMYAGELPLDWGAAELIAYASLVEQGYEIRLTGQDVARGTFFHRHAVLHEEHTGQIFVPLAALAERQARVTITDSTLSEEAVLGFEYGYSTASPQALVAWEAQFGDFGNGAQVVIDQFISSGEAKWGRVSGITLLLPHGYEGQGPEHSSARLERFLQLCAEFNMQVCVPSTPAQMYHLLRRQMLRPQRKPLIVMTPKSLLRHKLAVSALAELAGGRFQNLIDETDAMAPTQVRRLVLCSGKVYYDLFEQRRADRIADVAIIRLEQLYPFPGEEYEAILHKYDSAHEIVWCQEEPQNQGAWYQIRHRLQEKLSSRDILLYAGRGGAAAPAVGIFQLHVEQQKALVAAALSASTASEGVRGNARLTAKTIRKSS